jgi:hypothetical protein
VSEAHPAHEAPVRLEDVARAALALAAEPDLDVVVGQFLAHLRSWAAPSAILAAVRAPDTESGWRLLPALSAGSGPLGAERTLPQLVQEAPEVVERPSFVKPREEVPGVRPRDNCVVPWWHEGRSGLLVLRGVPRPCPPNLPEAVALLSGPLWPRLVGGPADRVETALAQIQVLAESLREETGRQVERLKAERAAAPPEAAPGQVAALEQALETARLELQGASAARDDFKARLSEAEKARDELAVGSRASETALGMARRELADVRQEAQRGALELEDFRERVTALEETLRAAEAERDRLRGEAEARPAEAPLSATVESLEAERAEAAEAARVATLERDQAEARARAAEERRHEAEQRRQALEETVYDLRGQLDAAREEVGRAAAAAAGGERVAELEATLQAAEEERSRLRGEVERLSAERRSEAAMQALEKERGLLEERVRQAEERSRAAERERQNAEDAQTRARQELAEAKQDAQRSALEVARLTDRLGAGDLALRAAEAERDRLGGEVGRLTARLESLRSDLAAVTEQLEAQRRVAEARAAAPSPSRAEPPPLPSPATAPLVESSASTAAVEALRGALGVLRRTPFVPPSLRVAMQEAQALVEGGGESSRPWLRVVLLDRDAASIEPLAAELEKAGIDTRIANYPEELALLMKTPDARDLHAIVCDVLAFRPDQNVAGLFRSWQKDRPSLALYLSFASDNPAETERAKRVPLSLTAGRFRRPLVREELVDMLTPLARRPESS